MKTLFLQALSNGKGRIVSLCIAAAVAFVTNLFARWHWTLDENTTTLVSSGAGFAAAWLVDSLAGYLKDQGTVALQTTLQAADPSLKADGVSGEKTNAAAATALASPPITTTP